MSDFIDLIQKQNNPATLSAARINNRFFEKINKYDKGLTTAIYDANINANPILEQEYFRSKNQGAGRKLRNGLLRFLPNVASQVGQTVGHIGGLGIAAAEQDWNRIWDNAVVDLFDQTQNKVREGLPIYKSRDYVTGNTADKLWTADFWAEDGFRGLEFLTSFYATGLASKALTFGRLNNWGSSLISTIGEAGFEAKEVVDSLKEKKARDYNVEKFEDLPESIQSSLKPELTNAGLRTFALNSAILFLPNKLQSDWLFGKKGTITREAIRSGATTSDNILKSYSWWKALVKGAAVEGIWEENIQTAISQYEKRLAEGTTYYKDMLPDLIYGVFNNIAGYAKLLPETLGFNANLIPGSEQDEGAASILLGSLLGGGMSMVGEYRNTAQLAEYVKGHETSWKELLDTKKLIDKWLVDDILIKDPNDKKQVANFVNHVINNVSHINEGVVSDIEGANKWQEVNAKYALASSIWLMNQKGYEPRDILDSLKSTKIPQSSLDASSPDYMNFAEKIISSLSKLKLSVNDFNKEDGFLKQYKKMQFYANFREILADSFDNTTPQTEAFKEETEKIKQRLKDPKKLSEEYYNAIQLPNLLQEKLNTTTVQDEKDLYTFLISKHKDVFGYQDLEVIPGLKEQFSSNFNLGAPIMKSKPLVDRIAEQNSKNLFVSLQLKEKLLTKELDFEKQIDDIIKFVKVNQEHVKKSEGLQDLYNYIDSAHKAASETSSELMSKIMDLSLDPDADGSQYDELTEADVRTNALISKFEDYKSFIEGLLIQEVTPNINLEDSDRFYIRYLVDPLIQFAESSLKDEDFTNLSAVEQLRDNYNKFKKIAEKLGTFELNFKKYFDNFEGILNKLESSTQAKKQNRDAKQITAKAIFDNAISYATKGMTYAEMLDNIDTIPKNRVTEIHQEVRNIIDSFSPQTVPTELGNIHEIFSFNPVKLESFLKLTSYDIDVQDVYTKAFGAIILDLHLASSDKLKDLLKIEFDLLTKDNAQRDNKIGLTHEQIISVRLAVLALLKNNKVIVEGFAGTGKTSMLARYITNIYTTLQNIPKEAIVSLGHTKLSSDVLAKSLQLSNSIPPEKAKFLVIDEAFAFKDEAIIPIDNLDIPKLILGDSQQASSSFTPYYKAIARDILLVPNLTAVYRTSVGPITEVSTQFKNAVFGLVSVNASSNMDLEEALKDNSEVFGVMPVYSEQHIKALASRPSTRSRAIITDTPDLYQGLGIEVLTPETMGGITVDEVYIDLRATYTYYKDLYTAVSRARKFAALKIDIPVKHYISSVVLTKEDSSLQEEYTRIYEIHKNQLETLLSVPTEKKFEVKPVETSYEILKEQKEHVEHIFTVINESEINKSETTELLVHQDELEIQEQPIIDASGVEYPDYIANTGEGINLRYPNNYAIKEVKTAKVPLYLKVFREETTPTFIIADNVDNNIFAKIGLADRSNEELDNKLKSYEQFLDLASLPLSQDSALTLESIEAEISPLTFDYSDSNVAVEEALQDFLTQFSEALPDSLKENTIYEDVLSRSVVKIFSDKDTFKTDDTGFKPIVGIPYLVVNIKDFQKNLYIRLEPVKYHHTSVETQTLNKAYSLLVSLQDNHDLRLETNLKSHIKWVGERFKIETIDGEDTIEFKKDPFETLPFAEEALTDIVNFAKLIYGVGHRNLKFETQTEAEAFIADNPELIIIHNNRKNNFPYSIMRKKDEFGNLSYYREKAVVAGQGALQLTLDNIVKSNTEINGRNFRNEFKTVDKHTFIKAKSIIADKHNFSTLFSDFIRPRFNQMKLELVELGIEENSDYDLKYLKDFSDIQDVGYLFDLGYQLSNGKTGLPKTQFDEFVANYVTEPVSFADIEWLVLNMHKLRINLNLQTFNKLGRDLKSNMPIIKSLVDTNFKRVYPTSLKITLQPSQIIRSEDSETIDIVDQLKTLYAGDSVMLSTIEALKNDKDTLKLLLEAAQSLRDYQYPNQVVKDEERLTIQQTKDYITGLIPGYPVDDEYALKFLTNLVNTDGKRILGRLRNGIIELDSNDLISKKVVRHEIMHTIFVHLLTKEEQLALKKMAKAEHTSNLEFSELLSSIWETYQPKQTILHKIVNSILKFLGIVKTQFASLDDFFYKANKGHFKYQNFKTTENDEYNFPFILENFGTIESYRTAKQFVQDKFIELTQKGYKGLLISNSEAFYIVKEALSKNLLELQKLNTVLETQIEKQRQELQIKNIPQAAVNQILLASELSLKQIKDKQQATKTLLQDNSRTKRPNFTELVYTLYPNWRFTEDSTSIQREKLKEIQTDIYEMASMGMEVRSILRSVIADTEELDPRSLLTDNIKTFLSGIQFTKNNKVTTLSGGYAYYSLIETLNNLDLTNLNFVVAAQRYINSSLISDASKAVVKKLIDVTNAAYDINFEKHKALVFSNVKGFTSPQLIFVTDPTVDLSKVRTINDIKLIESNLNRTLTKVYKENKTTVEFFEDINKITNLSEGVYNILFKKLTSQNLLAEIHTAISSLKETKMQFLSYQSEVVFSDSEPERRVHIRYIPTTTLGIESSIIEDTKFALSELHQKLVLAGSPKGVATVISDLPESEEGVKTFYRLIGYQFMLSELPTIVDAKAIIRSLKIVGKKIEQAINDKGNDEQIIYRSMERQNERLISILKPLIANTNLQRLTSFKDSEGKTLYKYNNSHFVYDIFKNLVRQKDNPDFKGAHGTNKFYNDTLPKYLTSDFFKLNPFVSGISSLYSNIVYHDAYKNEQTDVIIPLTKEKPFHTLLREFSAAFVDSLRLRKLKYFQFIYPLDRSKTYSVLVDLLTIENAEKAFLALKEQLDVPHNLNVSFKKGINSKLLQGSFTDFLNAIKAELETLRPLFIKLPIDSGITNVWDSISEKAFKYDTSNINDHLLYNFLINHYLNGYALNQLSLSNFGYYNTTENLIKRNNGPTAARQRGYVNSSGIWGKPTFKMLVLEDTTIDKDDIRKMLLSLLDNSEEKVDKLITDFYSDTGYDITDAQGFMTPLRYNDVVKAFGNGYSTANVLKPVYYGIQEDSTPVYVKYSSIVLSDSLVEKYRTLARLRRIMEKEEVDEIVFQSAVKVGKPKNLITMTDFIGNKSIDLGEFSSNIPENSVLNLDSKYWGLQLNPYSEVGSASLFTQLIYLANVNKTKPDVVKNVYKALGKIIEKGLEKTKKTFNTAFEETVKTSLIKQGDELYLRMLEEGVSINNPLIERKILSSIISQIEKATTGIKLPGGKFVLQSAEGLSGHGILRDPNRKDNKLRYFVDSTNKRLYAEAIVPRNLLTAEQIDALNKGVSIFTTPDFFGFRTPSTGLHSAIPLKIVGVYDDQGTNVIIVPREIVALHGSDYDVDQLTVITRVTDSEGFVGYNLINGKYQFDFNSENTSKDYYINMLIESFSDLISTEANREQMLTPISMKEMENLIEELNMKLNPNTDVNLFSDKLKVYENMQAGQSLTGVFANNFKFLAFILDANKDEAPTIETPFTYDNIIYNRIQEKDTNGKDIWQRFDAFINAAIDNVKVLLLPSLNINTVNGNALFAMLSLGLPLKSAVLILNQPKIKDINKITTSSGVIKELNDIINTTEPITQQDFILNDNALYNNLDKDNPTILNKTAKILKNMIALGEDITTGAQALKILRDIPVDITEFEALAASLETIQAPTFNYKIPSLFDKEKNPYLFWAKESFLFIREFIKAKFIVHSSKLESLVDTLKIKGYAPGRTSLEQNVYVRRELLSYLRASLVTEELRKEEPFLYKTITGRERQLIGGKAWSQRFIAKVKAVREYEKTLQYNNPNYKPNLFLKFLLVSKSSWNSLLNLKFTRGLNLTEDEKLELEADFVRLRNYKLTYDENNNVQVTNIVSDLNDKFTDFQFEFVKYALINFGFNYAASNYSQVLPPALYAKLDTLIDTKVNKFIDNVGNRYETDHFVLSFIIKHADKLPYINKEQAKLTQTSVEVEGKFYDKIYTKLEMKNGPDFIRTGTGDNAAAYLKVYETDSEVGYNFIGYKNEMLYLPFLQSYTIGNRFNPNTFITKIPHLDTNVFMSAFKLQQGQEIKVYLEEDYLREKLYNARITERIGVEQNKFNYIFELIDLNESEFDNAPQENC